MWRRSVWLVLVWCRLPWLLWLPGDLSREGSPAAGIGDEAGGLAPSIHTAVLGDSAG